MISMIAAIGEGNRVLGKDNKLLWRIPEDSKFFRETTKGHPVIMGRKTYESMGRPLPHRTNIVVTRDDGFKPDGVRVVHSIEEGIEVANQQYSVSSGMYYTDENKDIRNTKYLIQNTENEVFIIGGGQIYTEALPLADRLYLTIVHQHFDGDAFFPAFPAFSKIIFKRDSNDENYSYTFLVLEKE